MQRSVRFLLLLFSLAFIMPLQAQETQPPPTGQQPPATQPQVPPPAPQIPPTTPVEPPPSNQIPQEVLDQIPPDLQDQIPPGTEMLPSIEQRAQQLREAGVPEADINKLLKRDQRPQNQPGQQDQTTPDQTGDGTTEEGQVEGQDENAVEADGENEETAEETDDEKKDETEETEEEDDGTESDKVKQIQIVAPNRIFGHHIFDGSASTFIRDRSTLPPDNYVIGPGDNFLVTVYGAAELNESLEVQEDGSVFRQYIGKLYVAGLNYREARNLLQKRYQQIIPDNSTIEITLGQNQRTIRVNIVGEVRNPGAYTIAASHTALNALYEAGGPTTIGTVRNIYIKRNGRTVAVMDIYQYLIDGKNDPIFLEDNDFIFVPVQNKIVEIAGKVRRPMLYELQEKENLRAILRFSGGVDYDAMIRDVQILRMENEREILIDFNLREMMQRGEDRKLLDGDQVIIQATKKGATNIIQAQGPFLYPGTYQLQEGDRVTDLIERAGGIAQDAFLQRAYVIRIKTPGELAYIPIDLTHVFSDKNDPNNIPLQYFDELLIFSKNRFREDKYIFIGGQVRNPGRFKIHSGMTLKDLLYLSGGPKPDADLNSVELSLRITVQDIDRTEIRPESFALGSDEQADLQAGDETVDEMTTEETDGVFEGVAEEDRVIRRIAVQADWQNDPSLDTILIQPYNTVRIFSKYAFVFGQKVEVRGSVNRPGEFNLTKGMTLLDLLYLAGGPKKDTDFSNIELFKYIDYKDKVFYSTDYKEDEITRVSIDEDWRTSKFLDSIRVSTFYKVLFHDKLEYLSLGQSVKIEGAVRKPGEYNIKQGMTLKDLLFEAGGTTRTADVRNIELFKYIEPEEQVFYSTEYKQDEIIRITIDEDWMKSDLADSILVGGYYKVTIHDRLEYLSLGQEVEVEGAVRKPGTYPVKQGMNLKDLLFQAGGLSRTADVEYVTFYKVIDDKEKGYFGYKTESPEIFRTSLVEDWMNSPMLDTIMVGKYRKIKFHRKGEFFQAGFVAVKGLVNKPGEYRILPNMNLKDLIYQAEGFSIQADLNHIELTRVVEQRDENGNITAIPIVVRNVVVDPNWQDDKELEKIEVNTFDQVFVRKDPNFELQESVYITGEVRVPGEYNKKIKAETLTSLIERANGLTDLAYVEGAVLRRDNIGAISIKLEKAMKRPKSKFNIPLQKGDELIIPPRLDVVSVVGNVLVPDTKLMFEKGNSRVKYYVNLSGGFERKTKKKQITVRYMNGSVKRTTSFFGIKNYPKVKQGSVITIPKKEEKAKNEGGGAGEERKPRISLEETVAAATGILTIILLIKSINSQ